VRSAEVFENEGIPGIRDLYASKEVENVVDSIEDPVTQQEVRIYISGVYSAIWE
jgi:hypothetical protein